jgi:hypothetical protein
VNNLTIFNSLTVQDLSAIPQDSSQPTPVPTKKSSLRIYMLTEHLGDMKSSETLITQQQMNHLENR